jgi:hypothetical protein
MLGHAGHPPQSYATANHCGLEHQRIVGEDKRVTRHRADHADAFVEIFPIDCCRHQLDQGVLRQVTRVIKRPMALQLRRTTNRHDDFRREGPALLGFTSLVRRAQRKIGFIRGSLKDAADDIKTQGDLRKGALKALVSGH